jgi:hypothetical protein
LPPAQCGDGFRLNEQQDALLYQNSKALPASNRLDQNGTDMRAALQGSENSRLPGNSSGSTLPFIVLIDPGTG